jgi:hypothetical protein
MAVEVDKNSIRILMYDGPTPEILRRNDFQLSFTRIEFRGGLSTPLAFVIVEKPTGEEAFLRFNAERQAFAAEFTTEFVDEHELLSLIIGKDAPPKGEEFLHNVANAVMHVLELHHVELSNLFVERLRAARDAPPRTRVAYSN